MGAAELMEWYGYYTTLDRDSRASLERQIQLEAPEEEKRQILWATLRTIAGKK